MSSPAPRRARGARRILTALSVGIAVAVAALVLVQRRAEVTEALSGLSTGAVLASSAAAVGGVLATMIAWRTLVADFGSRLPLGAAGRVFFLGQLGKYVPGSVWPVLAQMELGRDYGVRRSTSAAAATLMLVLGSVSAVTVVLVVLPFTDRSLLAEYAWVAVAVIPLLALLLPAVQQRLTRWVSRLSRRDFALPRGSLRGTVTAFAWLLVSWLLLGWHLHLLVRSACSCATASLPLDVGVFALAWVSGFLVIIAPAGAGIREGVLVLGLAPVLDPAAALLVALVSRVVLTAVDLGLAGVGVLAARRHSGSREPRPPSP